MWERFQFDFVVTRPRRTKFGDFTVRPFQRERITVNANLNPYNFLITYLHEVAHLEVHRSYKRKQPAHGQAWKNKFKQLLLPVLNTTIFPEPILVPLVHYAQNPKYSTSSHLPLMLALQAFDASSSSVRNSSLVPLHELSEGDIFKINRKVFIYGTLRRTRVVCLEKNSKKRYTVAAHAMVEKLEH